MSVLMPGEAQGAESEPVAARGMDGCDWVGASGFRRQGLRGETGVFAGYGWQREYRKICRRCDRRSCATLVKPWSSDPVLEKNRRRRGVATCAEMSAERLRCR